MNKRHGYTLEVHAMRTSVSRPRDHRIDRQSMRDVATTSAGAQTVPTFFISQGLLFSDKLPGRL